jgi:hypothetical protein
MTLSRAPLICSTKGAADISYFMVLRMPLAIGRAAEPSRLQGMSVLDHIDPGASRQADGVDPGFRHGLEAGEAGKGAVLGRAFGRGRKSGFRGRYQRKCHCRRGNGGKFGAGGEIDAIRRGQRGALMLDRPFELVAAARFLRSQCGSRIEQQQRDEQSVSHDSQSTAIMTWGLDGQSCKPVSRDDGGRKQRTGGKRRI